MAEYSTLKVPELKKILGERGLPLSGNKADLISRLEEDDKKAGGKATATTAAEDEIDWDEDEKTAIEPTTPAVTKTSVPTPAAAVPAKKPEVTSPKTEAQPTTKPDEEKKAPEPKSVSEPSTAAAEPAPAPAPAPKDFSIGLQKSDAEKEAEKRAARAKRFGIPENEEAKKLSDRAKKFGLDKEGGKVVEGLDNALPDRKRGRERQGGRVGGVKRQAPDRRVEGGRKVGARPAAAAAAARPAVTSTGAKKQSGKITDDPTEKAKAAARAARFAKPASAA